MKIFRLIVAILIIIFITILVFVPQTIYYTNSNGNPNIGGNPGCLGLSIPQGCNSYSCENLCIGKVVYYGTVRPDDSK